MINELVRGDAVELLKLLQDNSVRLVFTDPPYGNNTYPTDIKVSEDFWQEIRRVGTDLFAIWGYPKHLFEWTKYFNDLVLLDYIVWFKYNELVVSHGLTKAHQDIAIWGSSQKQVKAHEVREPYSKGYGAAWLGRGGDERHPKPNVDPNGKRCTDVWVYPAPATRFNSRKRKHPNEKPEELAERVILLLTEPGDLVLDPFAGSGTILRACQRLGRQYIGYELDENFSKVAAKRLDMSYSENVF